MVVKVVVVERHGVIVAAVAGGVAMHTEGVVALVVSSSCFSVAGSTVIFITVESVSLSVTGLLFLHNIPGHWNFMILLEPGRVPPLRHGEGLLLADALHLDVDRSEGEVVRLFLKTLPGLLADEDFGGWALRTDSGRFVHGGADQGKLRFRLPHDAGDDLTGVDTDPHA